MLAPIELNSLQQLFLRSAFVVSFSLTTAEWVICESKRAESLINEICGTSRVDESLNENSCLRVKNKTKKHQLFSFKCFPKNNLCLSAEPRQPQPVKVCWKNEKKMSRNWVKSSIKDSTALRREEDFFGIYWNQRSTLRKVCQQINSKDNSKDEIKHFSCLIKLENISATLLCLLGMLKLQAGKVGVINVGKTQKPSPSTFESWLN